MKQSIKDLRFLRLAAEVASWSKDPSAKVGAVIVGRKGQVISQGYNGFPRGFDDSPERYADRETKYRLIIHAEANAIYNALCNGSCVEGATIYVHGLPCCRECAKAIVQSGIVRVVYDTAPSERWRQSCEEAMEIFREAGTEAVMAETEADAEETLPDWEKRLRREIEESHPDRTLTDFMERRMEANSKKA